MVSDQSWEAIFHYIEADGHDFETDGPLPLSAKQIKAACQDFTKTAQKEVRILCTQTTREMRPMVFKERDLFLLPTRNGYYCIIHGEGYMDVPGVPGEAKNYTSNLSFELESSKVGNSEMQHLDFAHASGLICDFMEVDFLALTIRGRKYTPRFIFNVGSNQIEVESVQTEVDAGYEGQDKIILIEAKNSKTTNTIIRQLYYPFRMWSAFTNKKVSTLFFERRPGEEKPEFHLWKYEFENYKDYNSIELTKSGKYLIESKS